VDPSGGSSYITNPMIQSTGFAPLPLLHRYDVNGILSTASHLVIVSVDVYIEGKLILNRGKPLNSRIIGGDLRFRSQATR